MCIAAVKTLLFISLLGAYEATGDENQNCENRTDQTDQTDHEHFTARTDQTDQTHHNLDHLL